VRLRHTVCCQKEQADGHHSEAPVWLSTKNFPLHLPCKKMSPQFVGPFKVLWKVNEVTYRLQLPTNYRISPSFHVSFLRPVVPSPLADAVSHNTPLPPLDIAGSPTFAISSLLGF
jgi:hypothetical protein